MASAAAAAPAKPRRKVATIDPALVAGEVAGALRAAARARRQMHRKPTVILLDAFKAASSEDGDGRCTTAQFVLAAKKMGLDVPIEDAEAVFAAAGEHVMRPDDATRAPASEDDADGDHDDDDRKENDAPGDPNALDATGEDARDAAGPAPPPEEPLLLYAPWVRAVMEGPRGAKTSSPKEPPSRRPTGRPNATAFESPPRRGPVRDGDAPVKDGDAFLYPQSRTPALPPIGFTARHLARAAALPDKRLELDHVHGCGPGLVDQNCPVPIFLLKARRRNVPEPGTNTKSRRYKPPPPQRPGEEDAVWYAAAVGVVETIDEDPQYAPPKPERRQRFFRGHVDDVRCLAVHASSRVAASGAMGASPYALVWSVDAAPGQPPLACLKHPRGSRAIVCVNFDAAGERVVTVCGDEGHTIALWSWRAGASNDPNHPEARVGKCLWRTRSYNSTPPAVRGVAFTPDLEDSEKMITFGDNHIKFWSPDDEAEAKAMRAAAVGDGSGVGDVAAKEAATRVPWRARAGRFAPAPAESVLCATFLPRATALGIKSFDDDESVWRGPCDLVTGSPRGMLLVWKGADASKPCAAHPGSRHRGPVNALALSADKRLLLSGDKHGGIMCWGVDTLRGKLGLPLGGIKLVESPPPSLDDVEAEVKSDVVAQSEIWLESESGEENLGGFGDPNDVLWLEKEPDVRGLAWSNGGTYALATTSLGSVWRVDFDGGEEEPEEDSDDDMTVMTGGDKADSDEDDSDDEDDSEWTKSTQSGFKGGGGKGKGKGNNHAGGEVDAGAAPWEVTEAAVRAPPQPGMKIIVRGHDSALTCVAWSGGGGARMGVKSWYATGARSGRVVLWDAHARKHLSAFDAGGPVRSVTFSPDGSHLAVGGERGRVSVFNVHPAPDEDEPDRFDPMDYVRPNFHGIASSTLTAAVCALAYSPDGKWLAAGDNLGALELFAVARTKKEWEKDNAAKTYRRRSKLIGHVSAITHIDWSADSRCVRTGSTSREVLHHEAPSGYRVTHAPRFHADARKPRRAPEDPKKKNGRKKDASANDERGGWYTWTSPLGFELMGIWREGQDGTDINGVWRTQDGAHVVSADDSGLVRVMNYPCPVERALSADERAHSSHVTAAKGSWCDNWVSSTGGRDCSVMQWALTKASNPEDVQDFFDHKLVGGVRGLMTFDLEARNKAEDGLTPEEIAAEEAAKKAAEEAAKKAAEDYDSDATNTDDEKHENAEMEKYDDVDDVLLDVAAAIPFAPPPPPPTYDPLTAVDGDPEPGQIEQRSAMMKMRAEVAARRRRLEKELKRLGHIAAGCVLYTCPHTTPSAW